jgi:hypothetical protein
MITQKEVEVLTKIRAKLQEERHWQTHGGNTPGTVDGLALAIRLIDSEIETYKDMQRMTG